MSEITRYESLDITVALPGGTWVGEYLCRHCGCRVNAHDQWHKKVENRDTRIT